ncbi:MAG: V-type ATP synthase subunit E [Candidatus Muiribacteriota bacterium]
MSVKDITSKIQEITNEKKAGIEKEAREEIKKQQEKYDKIIQQKKDKVIQSASTRGKELRNGIVIQEKLRMRNKMLQEKQNLVQTLFDKLKKELDGLNKEKYLRFYSSVLEKQNLKGKKCKVLKTEAERKIDADFVKELAKKNNLNLELGDEKVKSDDGGFILKIDFMEMDFTHEAVVKEIREEKEKEVVKILF